MPRSSRRGRPSRMRWRRSRRLGRWARRTYRLRKRFSHGLQASASWTWSHEIDDGQSNGSGALFFSSASNWTYNGNWKADKGNGSLDHRHRLVYNFVWAPKVTNSGSRVLKGLLNDWQLSAIST